MKNFNYSWRQIAKASFVGIATTATFYLAKTTGLFSSWSSTEETLDSSISLKREFADEVTFLRGNDGQISAGQRRLLQQGSVTIVNPIPDQVIQVNEQYIYSLDNVFLGNYSLIGALETEKNSLPNWLSVQPKLLSTTPAGSSITYGVAVNGSTAFVANWSSGLQIFDIANPSMPRLISIFNQGTQFASVVALNQNKAYLLSYNLQIIDVSNTSNPKLLSSIYLGTTRGIAVNGNTVFVAAFLDGLKILDVSNLTNPRLLSTFPVSGGIAWSVAVNGNTAFVADDSVGLQIIDVSNTSNPRLLSIYPSGGAIFQGVVMSGNTAFIAYNFQQIYFNYYQDTGLKILDVSNTSNPLLLSTLSVGTGVALQITISGNTVFIADGSAGLKIFDVSNASKPQLISACPSQAGTTWGVATNANTVLVANYINLQILDISRASLTGIAPLSGIGQQISITVAARDMAMALASDRFLLTLDQLPQVVTSTVSDQSIYPAQSRTLSLSSTRLFVNPGGSFLKLSIKLNNGLPAPSWLKLNLQPIMLATAFTGLGFSTVTVSGNTVFLGATDGLRIVDVSTLTNPRLLVTYPVGGKVAINGSLGFLAGGTSGFRILDISNTSNPRLLSTYPTYNAYDVAISGNRAFVADDSSGLKILDITNISNPRLLSTFKVGSGFAEGVAVRENTVFVANYYNLQMVDVSNGSNPQLLATQPTGTSGTVYGVAAKDDTILVADGSNVGLQILNVSNTSNLILLSTYPNIINGEALCVRIYGTTAFVADGAGGLQILDVSNMSNPWLLASHPGGGNVRDIAVRGNTAFLADMTSSTAAFWILDLSQWQLTIAPGVSDVGNYQLQLIATDELGGSAFTQPFTIRVEGPPQFHSNISTQFAKVGQAFNYFIPQGLVTDPNFDAMVFTAKLISGQELPSWLSFNAVSATFAGTPPSSAVGNITILLSVTDNIAGSVNTTFVLEVSHAPVVNQRIADQVMGIGRNNSFAVPSGTFTHPDNFMLVYSAKRSNGLTLPAWLVFNNIGILFTGQPNATDAGIVSVQVTADDQAGGQASTQFNLRAENFPRINQPILAQSAGVGVPYRFSVLNSFVDDDGDTMTYQTSQIDGSSLPSWLSFNAFGLEFSGTPTSSDLETFAIRFSATDSYGGQSDQLFNMTVTYFPTVGTPVYPQVSCVDQLYQFVVPSNTFLAGGAGFTYAARQSNGQPLPLWLSLDGISGTFSGIPAASDVDQLTLTLIGSANNGGMASTDFTLTTTTCPSLRNPVVSRVTNVNTPFALTLAGDTFDNGGMTLTLSAERTDHSALPNWLSFNPVSGVLAGVPLASDVKMELLQVVARNPLGGQAVAPFNLSVCYFPTLTAALPTLPFLRAQRAFTFTVPSGTFFSQTGALLQYQAQRADGSALPSWLAFNATQQRLFGTPGLTDLGNFNLQIIASDPACGSTPAPLPLVVQQNYPPEVVHPLTNQVAAVGTRFTFFAPTDTFTDRNSDPLNYTAAQSNGQSLPRWLHFAANTLSFSGTPGRGDTDAFSDKVLTIALTAHDDKSQTSANFNINVQGTSNVLLFIKIAAPIFSVLTTALALYSQRGRILNHCKPQRYQRLEDYTVTIGEPFEYKFATPSDQIIKVRSRIAKENKGCCRLFQVPRQALPGGTDLPLWMEYNPETNVLRSKGPVPTTKLRELFVQAKGSAERTLEQFTLRIVQPELSQEAEVTAQPNLSSEPDAPTSSGSGDVEMQTLHSTAPRVSF